MTANKTNIRLNKSFTTIKDEIVEARKVALREAKEDWKHGVFRSRGFWLVAQKDGNSITELEDYTFASKKELVGSIIDLIAEHGSKLEFFIEGGYNGADSPYDMNEGDYTPWVSEWSIELDVTVC